MPRDMDTNNHDASVHYRRRHERIPGKIQAKLVTQSGDRKNAAFFGFTRDLCLQGLFLEFPRMPSGVQAGDQATLELGILRDKKVLPCRIAHVTAKGIGVKIEASPAEFSGVLSDLLFSENQLRLGTDLTPQEQKTVILHSDDGPSLEGRIDKISISQLECIVDATPSPLNVGQAVTVHMTGTNGATLRFPGVVRKTGGSDVERSRLAVLFSSMPEETLNEIRAVVSQFHRDRFERITQARVLSHVSGEEKTVPTTDRKQIGQQLHHFFGEMQPK